MEDDREMRPDEAMITEPAGDRDREHRHSDRREDDRERSRSRERRHRDDDRHRHRRRSYSRSRSPRGHRHRSRSPSRSRSRDRGDRDRREYRDRHRHRSPPTMLHGRGRYGAPRQEWEKSVGGPMNAPAEEAEAHAKVSKRENRLYVGNLAYDVNYKDLEKFMSGAGGQVIFSEVLVTPAGQSKGCGIVEFATEDEAKQAKAELSDKPFMGRSVFIREDREETARFGAAPIPGKIGLALGEARNFLGQNGGSPITRNIYVANLPLQASWQDLKDLMRQAGEVIRTDIGMTFDGRPKGSGTVVFVDPEGAKQAIEMFNGYDWFGNILEVREDRFPNPPGSHRGRGAFMGGGFAPGFRGGFAGGMGFGRGGFAGGFGARGGFGGGFGGGRGGFGMGLGRGGFGGRGGFAGGRGGFQGGAGPDAGAGGRDFSNDLYADYNGGVNGGGMAVDPAEPNQQIYVRNLPWSTSNEDLVELFETVGNVVTAEILYDGNRSRGEGVVQFTETAEAQIAGEKFTGYMYGGRPLGVSFNKHWHEFSPSAAKGGQTAA